MREPEEHYISNIGGQNIPLSTFDAQYTLLDPADTIILYCASGARSSEFAKRLTAKGFTKVLNLKNGINALGVM